MHASLQAKRRTASGDNGCKLNIRSSRLLLRTSAAGRLMTWGWASTIFHV